MKEFLTQTQIVFRKQDKHKVNHMQYGERGANKAIAGADPCAGRRAQSLRRLVTMARARQKRNAQRDGRDASAGNASLGSSKRN